MEVPRVEEGRWFVFSGGSPATRGAEPPRGQHQGLLSTKLTFSRRQQVLFGWGAGRDMQSRHCLPD